MKSSIKLSTQYLVVLCCSIFIANYSSVCLAQVVNNTNLAPYAMTIEYAQPGLVWQYGVSSSSKPMLATFKQIRQKANTYVIIHGAHNGTSHDVTDKLIQTIRSRDSNANYLVVDWSYWAQMRADQSNEITSDMLMSVLMESAFDLLNADEINMPKIAVTLLKNAVFDFAFDPTAKLEKETYRLASVQSRKIIEVARRSKRILFETGEIVLTTDKKSFSTQCLGLDPARTHLIGFGHGAHVAGQIGKILMEQDNLSLKRISAFDPTTPALAKFDKASLELLKSGKEKKVISVLRKINMGEFAQAWHMIEKLDKEADPKREDDEQWYDWDKSCAQLVDVYNLSRNWSSDRLYGHINLLFPPDTCSGNSVLLFHYLVRDVGVFLEIKGAVNMNETSKGWIEISASSSSSGALKKFD